MDDTRDDVTQLRRAFKVARRAQEHGNHPFGAILVGLARAASVHLLPQAELFVIYLVMAAVLMFRPEGLFKRETARRI